MNVEGAGALEGRERIGRGVGREGGRRGGRGRGRGIGRGVGMGGDGEEEGEWYVGSGRRGGRG